MVGGGVPLPPSKQLKSGRGLNVGFRAVFYSKLLQTTLKYGLCWWLTDLMPSGPACGRSVVASKSAVLVGSVWPAEGPLRPAENLNARNIVKSCEFCESDVIFDD